jgi:hypothetical protein
MPARSWQVGCRVRSSRRVQLDVSAFGPPLLLNDNDCADAGVKAGEHERGDSICRASLAIAVVTLPTWLIAMTSCDGHCGACTHSARAASGYDATAAFARRRREATMADSTWPSQFSTLPRALTALLPRLTRSPSPARGRGKAGDVQAVFG